MVDFVRKECKMIVMLSFRRLPRQFTAYSLTQRFHELGRAFSQQVHPLKSHCDKGIKGDPVGALWFGALWFGALRNEPDDLVPVLFGSTSMASTDARKAFFPKVIRSISPRSFTPETRFFPNGIMDHQRKPSFPKTHPHRALPRTYI